MRQAEFQVIDGGIDRVAKHACHALLALERLRLSPDPALRLAYREVHDLIGDLGALRMELNSLPPVLPAPAPPVR
jgi:predicted solute-binding protein